MGAEDTLAEVLARVEENEKRMADIHAMYAQNEAMRNRRSSKKGSVDSLDIDHLVLVKGKAGKLGRGAQGVVKLGHYQPGDARTRQPVAVKMVPVEERAAQAALQVGEAMSKTDGPATRGADPACDAILNLRQRPD